MNEHYAIVIGLSNYPRFTDPPADLRGPVNDAEAVRDWLLTKGGIDEKNMWFAASSAQQPKAARPTRDQLDKAMVWLDARGLKNANKGNGRKVGRRLYIYIAGHGFSPVMRQGCLLAGNASPTQVNANIGVSNWLEWLQDANYFREYVLLMDCCMNRVLVATPMPAPVVPYVDSEPPFATFVALAAQRPLKAVEVAIPADKGKFHGVFTWAFLKGLEGAAANRYGIVNGHSMANWLRNAVYPWLTPADRADTDVSKQPEIVAEDAALVFATGVAPLPFKVTLKFPADAVGKPVRLWSGTPPRAEAFQAKARMERKLPAGLYVVEVPDAGYRQGFEIVRDETVVVAEQGPKVIEAAAADMFDFEIGVKNAEISIVAADFETLMANAGTLSARLPAGIYKSVVRIGRDLVPQVVLLDRHTRQNPKADGPATNILIGAAMQVEVATPQLATAVPFRNAANSHEYQADAAQAAVHDKGSKRYHKVFGSGAELMIMARNWSASGNSATSEPWKGVRLVDKDGVTIVDLSTTGKHSTNGDPFALCRMSVAPGTYYLRHPFDGHTLEQALVVTAGWRLEAYLLRRKEQDSRPRVSLLLRKIGQQWGLGEDETIEKARVALADERPLLDSEVQHLLTGKFDNPLAGILGVHLLLLGRETGMAGADFEVLNKVIMRLRRLVGDDHPDVEALSLACPDPALRRTRPVLVPPLFERSWRLLVEASYTNSQLVPVELWKRQVAQAPVPPFLVWSVGDKVRKTYETALVEAAFGKVPKRSAKPAQAPIPAAPADEMEMALEAAVPMGMPEAVATAGSAMPATRELSRDRGRMLQLPQSAIAALRDVGR